MKAMLLCAGLGTRLRPITNTVPKPLVPVFDVPAVADTLELLRDSGIEDVVVNLHHLPGKVKAALGDKYSGVNIEYSHEHEILGAVGGIRKALPLLGDGPITVINGDILFGIDLRAIIDFHKRSGAALTLAAGKIRSRPRIHVVGADKSGRVHCIRDHCSGEGEPRDYYVNLGVFVYESSILREYASEYTPFGFADKEGLISKLFANNEPVMIYRNTQFYWNDIGTPADYLQAHFDALDGTGTSRCLARANFAKPDVCPAVVREPVYIGHNVEIEKNVVIGPYAVIGSGTKIGKGACVKQSVAFPGSTISQGAAITGSVVVGSDIVPVENV